MDITPRSRIGFPDMRVKAAIGAPPPLGSVKREILRVITLKKGCGAKHPACNLRPLTTLAVESYSKHVVIPERRKIRLRKSPGICPVAFGH